MGGLGLATAISLYFGLSTSYNIRFVNLLRPSWSADLPGLAPRKSPSKILAAPSFTSCQPHNFGTVHRALVILPAETHQRKSMPSLDVFRIRGHLGLEGLHVPASTLARSQKQFALAKELCERRLFPQMPCVLV